MDGNLGTQHRLRFRSLWLSAWRSAVRVQLSNLLWRHTAAHGVIDEQTGTAIADLDVGHRQPVPRVVQM